MQVSDRIDVHFSGSWEETEKEEILQKAIPLASKNLVGVLLFQDEKNVKSGGKKGYVLVKQKVAKTYIRYE